MISENAMNLARLLSREPADYVQAMHSRVLWEDDIGLRNVRVSRSHIIDSGHKYHLFKGVGEEMDTVIFVLIDCPCCEEGCYVICCVYYPLAGEPVIYSSQGLTVPQFEEDFTPRRLVYSRCTLH